MPDAICGSERQIAGLSNFSSVPFLENAAHTVCQPDKNRTYILPLIRSCGVSASEKSANTSKKKIAAAIIIIDSIIRSPSFLLYIADISGSQGLSPTYEQAHVGLVLLTLSLMPADCSVLRTPTILPDSRISWDYHPTFMLLSGRVTRPFTHL